jgi:hypothetical protein
MLQNMRNAGNAAVLIAPADFIPDGHQGNGCTMIFSDHESEAIAEMIFARGGLCKGATAQAQKEKG